DAVAEHGAEVGVFQTPLLLPIAVERAVDQVHLHVQSVSFDPRETARDNVRMRWNILVNLHLIEIVLGVIEDDVRSLRV
ncbi:hypothetical protein PFISCL1PPCAC_7650, partial [Pristionchus fissidentatus]